MKIFFTILALLSPALGLAQTSLFDGKTLDGWDYKEGLWKVEDGAVTVGSHQKKFPRNEWISTKKTYANFELKLKIKCSGDPKTGLINSGIQIRSARLPNGRVAGYQVDCGEGWFGKIYDEHRRKLIYPEPLDQKALLNAIDVQGWNNYRILAEGPRIQVWINDVKASDYTEKNPLIPLNGIIAPQIHSGGHVKVQFKDITIRELPATEGAPTWESLGGVQAALNKVTKPKKAAARGKKKSSNKIPAPAKGADRVTFDFESGDLQGWYIADGWFHHLIADNKTIRAGGGPSNKEGKFFIGTLETAAGGAPSDQQVGIVESPVFQLTDPKIDFALSGGKHANTYLGLYTLDGKEVRKASAGGSETFIVKTWSAPELVGKPVFLRLVDKNTSGWGHITLDAFSAKGKLLPQETKKRKALAKPKKPSAKEIATLKKKAKPKRVGKKTQSARTTALSPAEQLASFTVPEGFVIELVASEENGVINPIDLTFDDAGRLWTQTGQMYPLDPISGMRWQQFLDLMKDEKTQNTHPEFKRIKDLYQLKTKGDDKILILDDPTKTASGPLHVWADGLSIPQSILPYKDGAYVCHGAELFLLRDTDGDDKADKMEQVLSGFGYTDTHTMSHLLVRGPGRYIHFSQGALNQGLVTAVPSGFQDRIDAACQVRFDLDHQAFEVLSAGPSNMWGLQLRANGQWYGTEANDRAYSVIPWEHGTAVTGAAFRPMRPYQPLLPELHKFRVGGTGISGLEFSEDTENSFPFEEWKDVALLANPITSTINSVRVVRNPDGTVTAEHLPDFLSSKDDWFRPVNLEFGPDGCLYVADFYNKIVSHNEVTTDHPDRDKAHGRIWRIRHESQKPRSIPDVTKASPAQLITHLKSPSLWEKRAAWQQIADRKVTELTPELIKVAADSQQDITTRIHALWALEELGHYDSTLLGSLLTAADDDLRREAVRSLSSFDLKPADAAALIAPFIEDANAMIRSQAIRSLGDLRSPDSAVLAALISACKPSLGGNALGGSYERNFERFHARMALERFPSELKSYLATSSSKHSPGNLLWAIQALDEKAREDAFLGIWNKVSSKEMDAETFISISGMLDNAKVFKAVQPIFQNPAKAENLVGQALANQSRVQSKKLTEMLTPLVSQLIDKPKTMALGLKAVERFRVTSLSKKVAAIPLPTDDINLLTQLLAAQSLSPAQNSANLIKIAASESLPFALRLDATHALAPVDQAKATAQARALLASADAAQKQKFTSTFSQSKAGGQILSSLIEEKVIAPDDFDLSAAERFAQAHPSHSAAKNTLAVARKRVAEQRKKAQERIHHLQDYITKNPGDPTKGKATFISCLACHQLGTEGQDIAPPLDGSGHRDLEHLLTAIVDPDAAVEGGYGLYRITKTNGSTIEGYLDRKEALGTTIALMGGSRLFVPQNEIKSEQFVGGRSFMPAMFGQLPEESMADLVAYIATLKEDGPQQKAPAVKKKTAALAPSDASKPNIILIFTDDQGYEDLGCFGSETIKTPRIDQMAAEGLKLTNFYAQPVCGVSRAALMTGSYPIRIAEPRNIKQLHTVPHPKEITMAEVLKSSGYATGIIGKWHLSEKGKGPAGFATETMPNAQGFDYFYGTPQFNGFTVYVEDTKMRSPILRNQEVVVEAVQSWDNITADYTTEAINYIEKNKDQPFFLYLAHNLPHIPVGASENFKGKSEYGPYGDTIEEIDWSTGQILDKLKEFNIDDNTLVIFTSDNGPWIETTRSMHPKGRPFIPRDHSGSAAPLRGYKMSTWDGGSKVPFIARWPKKIEAGRESDELLSTLDLLPTFAQLAKTDLPQDRTLDGRDAIDFLLGKDDTSPREDYFYYSGCLLTGVRDDQWKLVLPRSAKPAGTGWWGRLIEEIKEVQLYDLDNDPGETKDLAKNHPEIVARLMKKIEQARAELGDIDVVGTGARNFDPQKRTLQNPLKKPTKKASKPAPADESRTANSSKPNFVIIFTDDQGYADLSCFGGKHVYTPNIDQMAKEGARLTSFYVAAPLCTPSRAALITGCYPARIDMDVPSSLTVAMKHIPPGRKFPVCLVGDARGLNPKELTIAEVAQSAGYKTGMFGKWHLGDQPEFLPTRQGFEEFFGIPYSHDMTPKHPRQKFFKFPPLPVIEGEKVIEVAPNADYLTRRITKRAVDFIKRNKDENFFLYVAHPLPHGPLAASPEIKKEYAEQLKVNGAGKPGIFPTTIYEIDWSVGEILKTLKEQGIDENTVVLFTTDNGPSRGSAKPLSGKKGSTLEGGQRVPTVIRWPKGIPAGTENDKVLTAMDILPTFAKLSGATLPDNLVIDGKDIMPAITSDAKSPHEYFFYAHWGVLEAVRWNAWKLRIIKDKEALYNLDADISEKKNVAAKHPEIVQQLKTAMQNFEKEMKANLRPAGTVANPKPLSIE